MLEKLYNERNCLFRNQYYWPSYSQTYHRIDYLLTWNCKHIANAQIRKKLEQICNESGYYLPMICTPDELMGA